MIDRQQFAVAMAAFADRIGRPLSPVTAEFYLAALDGELTTDEFMAGARIVFKRHTYNTWPSPQEFIDAIKAKPVSVDGEKILRQIEKLSVYLPTTGMIPPHVGKVRDELGDDIADAYATAGAARCFSENDTTREIASRDFLKGLEAAVERAVIRGDLPRLDFSSHSPARLLPKAKQGVESIADVVTRALPPGAVSA